MYAIRSYYGQPGGWLALRRQLAGGRFERVYDLQRSDRSASSFDSPDFVEVVIHSYRHRYGLVPGDPAYAEIETRLAAQPKITVPAVTIDGDASYNFV